jgi:trypsin
VLLALLAAASSAVVGGSDSADPRWSATAYVVAAVTSHDGAAAYSVCSGVLIAPRAVLTAAHCIPDRYEALRVYFGASGPDPGTNIAAAEMHEVRAAVRHPTWDGSHGVDLGVLHLATASAIAPHEVVAPACVAARGFADGVTGTIVGYGSRTVDGGPAGDVRLQMAPVRIVDDDCNDPMWADGCDRAGEEFVGDGAALGTSTCSGDSGGPFYVPGDRPRVVGITSRGKIEDEAHQCIGPAIYVRPDAHLAWILDEVGDAAIDDCDESGGCTASGSHAPWWIVLAALLVVRRRRAIATLLCASPAMAAPIVGGDEAPAGAYPDVVAVQTRYGRCTGTLIAPDLVATASHCLEAWSKEISDPQRASVVIGVLDHEAQGLRIEAAREIMHPELDVAILVLAAPAEVRPRPLAIGCAADAVANGTTATAIGFGATSSDWSDANSRLHETRFAIVDAECATPERWENGCVPGTAAIASSAASTACFGDSGGPLLVDGALAGVASSMLSETPTGELCPAGNPIIYVRIDLLHDWIESSTGRSLDEPACASDGGGCSTNGGSLFALLLTVCVVVSSRTSRSG